MAHCPLEDKLTSLVNRVARLQNQNSTLRLQVKDLRYEVDLLKNTKTHNASKNNHMSSTHSINDKPSRNSEKIQTSTTIHRVDEKKKEMPKPARNVLTPSSNFQNTSANIANRNQQLKPNSKPSSKGDQSRGTNPPNTKAQLRKTIPHSNTSTNLLRSISQQKKSFQFYSFMPPIKEQMEKVISIEKLQPSYQNSPNKNERHVTEFILEEEQCQNPHKWGLDMSLSVQSAKGASPKSKYLTRKSVKFLNT